MPWKRREFLQACGTAGASILFFPGWNLLRAGAKAGFPRPKGGILALDRLNQAVFHRWLNQSFRVSVPEGNSVALKLIEVADGPDDPSYDQFSLLFLGPPETALPQNVYAFESPSGGTFSILIVPIGPGANGLHYEAVFNRAKSAPRLSGVVTVEKE